MKVLILGGTGMLGQSLVPTLSRMGLTVVCHGRADAEVSADLTSAEDTRQLISRVLPDALVNLVGLTDVERCEAFPKEAWRHNVLAAQNVAEAAAENRSYLVHVSTDQVYDGVVPSTEDQASPGNVYALSKHAGELAASGSDTCVLRTNFFGASKHKARRSITDWIYGSLKSRQPICVFEDVYFSPLSMQTLAEIIGHVLEKRPSGTFNAGSCGCLSKAEFAFKFARASGLAEELMRRTSIRESTAIKAWRPTNMCMNSSRLEHVLGRTLPSLEDEIILASKEYVHGE